MLPLELDYRSRVPISEQLVAGIVRLVACDVLSPGEQLPSVRSMAQQLGINPNTVQKAYRALEQLGTIYSLPGKGSFVSEGDEARELQKRQALESVDDALRAALDAGVTAAELDDHCRHWMQKTGGLLV
ncbi:MAG: GntR family transcriptional regulator [Clostridiales bacterium]|nr:GntR family transcriptional regulator [Clostridiales bacterium]